MPWGPNVESALRDAAGAPLDERGLMPLPVARDVVASTTTFDKEGADRLWAALVSLDDAAEAVAALEALRWRHPPRGRDNTALAERYGAGLLPWLAGRRDGDVLVNVPWCVGPCLVAIGDVAALELVWSVAGYRDRMAMVAWQVTDDGTAAGDPGAEAAAADALRARWIDAHPEVALPWIEARASKDDLRAIEWLARRARRGTATEEAILEALDAANQRSWPEFNYATDNRVEYFGLRLIAARERAGDGWGVVLERLTGAYPDMTRIERTFVGSAIDPESPPDQNQWLSFELGGDDGRHLFHGGAVQGPGGDVVLDESMIDRFDLRPRSACEDGIFPIRIPAIRAWLAVRGLPWGDPAEAVAHLELDDPEILVVTDRFAHVIGRFERDGVPATEWQLAPSESPCYRSLAAALAARDPSRFESGAANTDWRLHAIVPTRAPLPWEARRTTGEDLDAAIVDAAVEADDRGLMPLEAARAVLAEASGFDKGEGRPIGDQWVQDSDLVWAALMSLEDASELTAAALRLDWQAEPRGPDNLAPVARYGEGVLEWLRGALIDGVLPERPACLRANLLNLDAEAAVDLLLDMRDPDLLEGWLALHASTGFRRLGELALAGHPAARARVERDALIDPDRVRAALGADADAVLDAIGVPRELSPRHVLAVLDAAAARPADDDAAWPRFVHGSSPAIEYGGLRVIAGRRDDAWAIVFERITGYGHRAAIRRYVFGQGAGAPGHRAELDVPMGELPDPEATVEPAHHTCEPPDYWTPIDRAPLYLDALRAWLDGSPGAAWPDPVAALAAALPGATPLVVSDSFEHAGGARASDSAALRSLAEAIAADDAGRFAPGASNLDWRLHATHAVELPGGDSSEEE